MAYRTEGRVNVVVHGARSPSDVEWLSYLNHTREWAVPNFRIVARSHGGAPDGRQRGELLASAGGRRRNAPIAFLTESPLVKGIAEALRHSNKAVGLFRLDEIAGACAFLGLNPQESARVAAVVFELEHELEQTDG